MNGTHQPLNSTSTIVYIPLGMNGTPHSRPIQTTMILQFNEMLMFILHSSQHSDLNASFI